MVGCICEQYIDVMLCLYLTTFTGAYRQNVPLMVILDVDTGTVLTLTQMNSLVIQLAKTIIDLFLKLINYKPKGTIKHH